MTGLSAVRSYNIPRLENATDTKKKLALKNINPAFKNKALNIIENPT